MADNNTFVKIQKTTYVPEIEEGKYYRVPGKVDNKQIAAGNTITNFMIPSILYPSVSSYLTSLTYSRDYPSRSNNPWVALLGCTDGAANIATASGKVIWPGYDESSMIDYSAGTNFLIATKSTQMITMCFFGFPMLSSTRLFFDPYHTPVFTASSYNWRYYGSETDEYANCDGHSAASFFIMDITESSLSISLKSLVAFRHDNGNSTYSYKLYISDYTDAHDINGNISGDLIYDNGWVEGYIDFGNHLMF